MDLSDGAKIILLQWDQICVIVAGQKVCRHVVGGHTVVNVCPSDVLNPYVVKQLKRRMCYGVSEKRDWNAGAVVVFPN